MDMTTTERNWLSQFTTASKAACLDMLKLRKRDYDGVIPPEVVELRKLKEQVTKVEKGHKSLTKVFRDLFKKGIGDIDEHVINK